jgi:regulator of protease activity HflC (stomatin/prohibitin superfamily)
MFPFQIGWGTGLIILALFIYSSLKILREYERAVVFRLGRLVGQRGPGLILILPVIESWVKIDTRTITMDIPPQEVITQDNVTLRVNAVAYFRVINPNDAVIKVANYVYATSQIAQTTLRSVLGQGDLDELLIQRDKINQKLQEIIDSQTEPWGIKVSVVEVKDIELPEEMKRAMAKQAEAEREKRAKIIHAEGEYQAAERLTQAAETITRSPAAIQLRFLQTLTELSATGKNSTIVFPVPIDLLKSFIKGEK